MEEFIYIEEKHQLLVCRPCRAAIRPGNAIEGHFRREHKLTGEILRSIKDYYSSASLSDPQYAELPADGTKANPSLKVLHGYSCSQCSFRTIARDNITRHYKAAGHGDATGNRWNRVKLQSWQQRRYARYWIVRDDSDEGECEELASADQGNSKLIKMSQTFDESRAVMIAAILQEGDNKQGVEHDSSWVKLLELVPHFESRDKMVIFMAAQWYRAKEAAPKWEAVSEEAARELRQLRRVAESFDREVDRCSWRLDSVATETRHRLASIDPQLSAKLPFSRKAEETSMAKYRSVGQRYLGFCWRAYQLGREEANTQYAVRFSDEQWSLLQDIVHELNEAEGIQDSSFNGSSNGNDGYRYQDEDEDEDEDEAGSMVPKGIATEAIDRTVFLFVVASIKDCVWGDLYTSPLLCFCAALAINNQPLGYREAHLYTTFLAGINWWARLFFLEAEFEGQPRDKRDVSGKVEDEFQVSCTKWLCYGNHSVMNTIIRWMTFGKGYRRNLAGQPTIRWSEDKETLFHCGEAIVVKDFKQTLRDLVTSAEDMLDKMTGGSWEQVGRKLDLRRICDNMTKYGAGQSFTSDPRNGWLRPGATRVLELLGSSVWDAARATWKKSALKAWLRQLHRFREMLIVLVHMWAGLPGRGPELTTLRHCDTWQLIRSIFIVDGQVMIVTDRDKMKALRDAGRKVARFLPDRIGKMMVAYIAWLLPLEEMLRDALKLSKPRADAFSFLWRNGDSEVWKTDRLSAILGRIIQAGTGVRMGLARYRPIAIEIGRQIRGLAIKQVELRKDEAEDYDDIDVDPMTGEPMECGGSWGIVFDFQSTHGTAIAEQHYAVHVKSVGDLQPEMVATYREVSRLWHQFWQYDSGPSGSVRKRKRDEAGRREAAAKVARLDSKHIDAEPPQQQDMEVELTAGLRELLGPGARWRSDKQAECMRAIMGLKRHQTMINVLPTGAGKSILFMLPALLRDAGTSIVVVPFIALMDDLVMRSLEMGVDCIQFKSSISAGRDGMPRAARLVVVSADVVASNGFASYADGLLAAGLLQRIFVDECHTAITDVGFRARLSELKSLHRYGCPLVLLTATLPVLLEDWFRREMLARSAKIIRDRTAKLNCRYRVEKTKPGTGLITHVVNTVRRLGLGMANQHKGVVYCKSKKQCEALAEEMGCDFHHSGMEDVERREARNSWASGRGSRWIAATTGLGTGIDIDGIVAIVHVDQPYGLVDFVQQTGRGGRRAGEVVDSVVVYNGRPPREDRHCGLVEEANQSSMSAFMDTTGCRRAVISAVMDGNAGETCEDMAGAELCDRCMAERESDRGGVPAQRKAAWTAFGKEQGRQVQTLLRWLDEVAHECPVCHVQRHQRGLGLDNVPDKPRHKQQEKWCRVINGEDYEEVRKRLLFGELSCCFICKLPLDWCEQTRGDAEGGEGKRCAHVDKVLPVVFMALKNEQVRQLTRERFNVNPDNEEEFFQWAARSRQFHGTAGTNALALWEAIVWRAYKGGRYWFSVNE